MNAAQLELWQKIEAFQVNQPGTRFTFEDRLARENRWTPEFARRVVGEYKRFLMLAMVAEHPVTPSDEVDQAWHLHMVYTESYWTELCGKVLPRPLHHGPTKGGRSEDVKFTNLYERTLASYRAMFGHEPPEDIWPSTRTRFERAPQFQRVNAAEHWIIPKPRLTVGRLVGASLGLVVLTGGALAAGPGSGGLDPAVLILGIVALGVLVMVVKWLSRLGGGSRGVGRGGARRPGGDASGCSAMGAGMWGWFAGDSGGHSHGHGHGHGQGHGHGHGHGQGSGGHDSSGHDSGGHGSGGHDSGGHDGGSSGCSSSGCSGSGCASSGCGGGGCSN